MSALDELDRYLKERNRISKREGEPTTRILNEAKVKLPGPNTASLERLKATRTKDQQKRIQRKVPRDYDGLSLSSASSTDSEFDTPKRLAPSTQETTMQKIQRRDPALKPTPSENLLPMKGLGSVRRQSYSPTARSFLEDIQNKKTSRQELSSSKTTPLSGPVSAAPPSVYTLPPTAAQEQALLSGTRSRNSRVQSTGGSGSAPSTTARLSPVESAILGLKTTAVPSDSMLGSALAKLQVAVAQTASAQGPGLEGSLSLAAPLPEYEAAAARRLEQLRADPRSMLDPLEEVRTALDRWRNFGPSLNEGVEDAPPSILDPSPVPLTAQNLARTADGLPPLTHAQRATRDRDRSAAHPDPFQPYVAPVDALATAAILDRIRTHRHEDAAAAADDNDDDDAGASVPHYPAAFAGQPPDLLEAVPSAGGAAVEGLPPPPPSSLPLPMHPAMRPHAPPHDVLAHALTYGVHGLAQSDRRGELLRHMLKHQRLVFPLLPHSTGYDATLAALPTGLRLGMADADPDRRPSRPDLLPDDHYNSLRSMLGLPTFLDVENPPSMKPRYTAASPSPSPSASSVSARRKERERKKEGGRARERSARWDSDLCRDAPPLLLRSDELEAVPTNPLPALANEYYQSQSPVKAAAVPSAVTAAVPSSPSRLAPSNPPEGRGGDPSASPLRTVSFTFDASARPLVYRGESESDGPIDPSLTASETMRELPTLPPMQAQERGRAQEGLRCHAAPELAPAYETAERMLCEPLASRKVIREALEAAGLLDAAVLSATGSLPASPHKVSLRVAAAEEEEEGSVELEDSSPAESSATKRMRALYPDLFPAPLESSRTGSRN